VTPVVVGLVVLGLALSTGLGIAAGFDATTVILLILIALFGLMAVAVARKSGRGSVAPARCASCGGVISPNAPYCKHCKAPVG
jgi:hypothetical protein